jgi:PAS domain S-box-containing protein
VNAEQAPAHKNEPGEASPRWNASIDRISIALGPPAAWSPTLKALMQLVLSAKQPMFLAWGAERIWIHNDAFIPIAGGKHPHALGRPAREVWTEAWAEIEPLFDRVFAGEPIEMTGFALAIDRGGFVEEAHFDFSYTPIREHDGGEVMGLFGVCNETTERIASGREELAMAEREHARILEMSRDLFAVASFDGRLKSINPAWSRQLDRSEHELLATPFSELIHPDDLAETANVVAALQDGHPVHQFHVRLLKADGSAIAYAWSAVPELDPPNGSFYTVGRDITEEREAAAELHAAQEALRQSQKMEAVGQLTGGIAHDFNNLLAGVSASLQVLQLRLKQGKLEGAERYILLGRESIRRAASLTQRLLAFSRRQTLDPRPMDVNRLVSGMEELIRGTAGPSIEVEVIGAADLWQTKIDASQLESSLLNLSINARDAMPNGGRLVVETANKWLDPRAATDWDLRPGQYISLCVTDTGVGMDAQTQARAFDPFFTTKPMGEGTGLGLSMVYGFVRQSGGQVRICSELGRGTTVSLYLPRHADAKPVEEEEESVVVGGAEPGDGETVLVIEDEETIRALVTEALEEAGYNVIGAADGPEGVRVLESARRIDLLLSDVGLPGGMNGRQVADAARAFRPQLKVLFVTGYAEHAAVRNGLLERGMEVMTKPFEVAELASRVRQMIDN